MDPYYADENIRRRIIEYLGGHAIPDATAVYITTSDNEFYDQIEVHPPGDLDHFFKNGLDIARSLWDRKSFIVHLDIEYVNFDFPAEPYLDLERCFQVQQAVVNVLQCLLATYSISPLHSITGRGHHFTWRITQDSLAFHQLSDLIPLSKQLIEHYRDLTLPVASKMSTRLGAAFKGLGLVMEFLAFQVIREGENNPYLPVKLSAVKVGPFHRGREIISIDLTEYGDPLHTRIIRVPFSIYRKPVKKGFANEPHLTHKIPEMFMVPVYEMNLHQAVQVMQDRQQVQRLAKRTSVRIPDCSKEMNRMIADYRESSLKTFHDWFYSQDHEPPEKWPSTYDQTPLQVLPPSPRFILKNPNDLLLRPECIELVVRTFLAIGWHPRHIAGLIRSKYERDFGWGNYWYNYNAAYRADFYTRLFAGLFVGGLDDLVDFNCLSSKEKGLCFHASIPHCNLDPFKESLLNRRKHDRLARWPFNRLFLPEQHT